jgi:hypothetical protein
VLNTEPVGSEIGADVKARFEALTFLATSKEEQILASRLRLASDVLLDRLPVLAPMSGRRNRSTW